MDFKKIVNSILEYKIEEYLARYKEICYKINTVSKIRRELLFKFESGSQEGRDIPEITYKVGCYREWGNPDELDVERDACIERIDRILLESEARFMSLLIKSLYDKLNDIYNLEYAKIYVKYVSSRIDLKEEESKVLCEHAILLQNDIRSRFLKYKKKYTPKLP